LWKNRHEHAWSIPKGEYEGDEDPEQAAEREFTEELGLPAPEGVRIDLGTIRQSGGKRVHAWAVSGESLSLDTVVSNTFEMEWPPKSGTRQNFPEIDRAEWVTLPDAAVRLVAAQTEFLQRLLDVLTPETD
jgi:predicted NUDIX family NTP pyrophosphohydrolase